MGGRSKVGTKRVESGMQAGGMQLTMDFKQRKVGWGGFERGWDFQRQGVWLRMLREGGSSRSSSSKKKKKCVVRSNLV